MLWESLGFKENPFSTDPIAIDTLSLYTGHTREIDICKDVVSQKNILMIIEGRRGVGTTSFANLLRFSMQEKSLYLTPRNEIRVNPDWNLETLLSAIISNVIREMEFFQAENIIKDKRFQNAKSISTRISETYRSFGVDAFGVGVNYAKNAGVNSQPVIVPASVLGHHLEDLATLAKSLGYKNGILLQLNNLDIQGLRMKKGNLHFWSILDKKSLKSTRVLHVHCVFSSIFCLTLPQNWKFVRIPAFVRRPWCSPWKGGV